MELPTLGKRCEVETCKQLDFLPIKCTQCGGNYCKDHTLPPHHACVGGQGGALDHTGNDGKDKVSISRHRCEVAGCKGGELTPVLCPHCEKNYCLAHRHQGEHSCPSLPPPDHSTQEATAAHIKKITDKMNSEKRGQGRRSQQLAAKVQLMKLKQKSIGEKEIPQADRIYLLVLLPKLPPSPSSSSSSSSFPVFISRHWSIGRAIDNIASLAKIKNNNNILGAPKLRVFNASNGIILGETDVLLNDLLGVSLFNGATIIMEYITEDEEATLHLSNWEMYKV